MIERRIARPGRSLRDAQLGHQARAGVVAAATAFLAVAATLTAAPAQAAAVQGAPVETHTQFCNTSLSARTDVLVDGFPGAQPQVGQAFRLVMTVVGLNQCLNDQKATLNVKLPAGVEAAPGGQSQCVTFASTNPANSGIANCALVPTDDGYLRVVPQGASQWTLPRTGRNVAQVQLAVRAQSPGEKTAFGHVCDFGSTTDCVGSPVANAIPFATFTVVAAPAPPPPPATVTADQVLIRKVGTVCGGCSTDLATTATSIKVEGRIGGQRPAGTLRVQRRSPGATSFSTVGTKSVPAGSSLVNSRLSVTAGGLQPATAYRFRSCYTPIGGTQVCGASIELTTKPA